jgi:hypothetical protein
MTFPTDSQWPSIDPPPNKRPNYRPFVVTLAILVGLVALVVVGVIATQSFLAVGVVVSVIGLLTAALDYPRDLALVYLWIHWSGGRTEPSS